LTRSHELTASSLIPNELYPHENPENRQQDSNNIGLLKKPVAESRHPCGEE